MSDKSLNVRVTKMSRKHTIVRTLRISPWQRALEIRTCARARTHAYRQIHKFNCVMLFSPNWHLVSRQKVVIQNIFVSLPFFFSFFFFPLELHVFTIFLSNILFFYLLHFPTTFGFTIVIPACIPSCPLLSSPIVLPKPRLHPSSSLRSTYGCNLSSTALSWLGPRGDDSRRHVEGQGTGGSGGGGQWLKCVCEDGQVKKQGLMMDTRQTPSWRQVKLFVSVFLSIRHWTAPSLHWLHVLCMTVNEGQGQTG